MTRVFLAVTLTAAALTGTAAAQLLVDYPADSLPQSPWVLVDNDPQSEPQNQVFVQNSVLHMVDNWLLIGNTLGYRRNLTLESDVVIDVIFRARIPWGESVSGSPPFAVTLQDGTVQTTLRVGPDRITSIGVSGFMVDHALDGTAWHDYRYRLTPDDIEWWVDDVSVGSAPRTELGSFPTTDVSIRLFITGGTAHVELDSFAIVQFGAGPDPGTITDQLQVARGEGNKVVLSWGESCAAATDYAVYRGIVGVWDAYIPMACSTGSETTATITQGSGKRYYLVVPVTASAEGSYGRHSDGTERTQWPGACVPQALLEPCP